MTGESSPGSGGLGREVTRHLVTDAWVDAGRTVLAIAGEVDLATAPMLGGRIADLAAAGHRWLVVDLTAVGFLDSAGLGALVDGRNRSRASGGDLSLVLPAVALRTLFEVTGLHQVFLTHPSVAEAVADPLTMRDGAAGTVPRGERLARPSRRGG